MTDDFVDAIKRILAARSGHVCSNPECRVPTSGPQDDPAKAVNLGVAAHITAASPGGPRYDPELSSEERSAASNGVWLCQNCAKLIDNDVVRIAVEVLKKWKADAEAEAKARVGRITASLISDVFIEVSVMNEDTSQWNRGEDTVLRYILDREANRIRIERELGYFTLFERGGPIIPLEYVMSPTYCPFNWDFPILDFKVLNNRQSSLFLAEVVLDVEESRSDSTPLLTIKKNTQQSYAGRLQLINEGGCALRDLNISFQLRPGALVPPAQILPPYPHSISVPLLEDRVEVDVTEAFQKDGVDIVVLILLSNGRWDRDVFVAPKADDSEERMTKAQMEARWEQCLGPFNMEVGTLAGEIDFNTVGDLSANNVVKFSAPVYLTNMNRKGILRPPSYKYDSAFNVQALDYQRRVQISHSLQPGEADRFTVKIAVPQSSRHRFHVTLRDLSGLVWQSVPIEMNCFVPRSRRKAVGNAISPSSAQ
jgi:hypothetical protein